ncbi:MAG: NlpC/P60 family protein [Methyloligellaceae bacterium]
MLPGARVVTVARSWIGTPYHHQASVKGAGCDCLGLVRGVYRELLGREPEVIPPYTPDWAEARGVETLLEGARRHLREMAPEAAQPGDVLVFRLGKSTMAKHMAILATPCSMIHAVEGAPVSEVHYGRWWRRHAAAAFRFPGAA